MFYSPASSQPIALGLWDLKASFEVAEPAGAVRLGCRLLPHYVIRGTNHHAPCAAAALFRNQLSLSWGFTLSS
ncbi:hypothetical protein J6590_031164 [Homalodisca vitripennis]|nr:hypothetical protein J6590_031164 [Homalodisca vitripennis]